MRIDGPNRAGPVQNGQATRRAGGASGFSLDLGATAAKPAQIATTAALAGLSALLDLQEIEAPAERRKRAVKRGHALLDRLDGLRIALLEGEVPVETLESLVLLVANREPSGDDRLEQLMADIDLRVRVELAKFGRFPA